MSTKIDPKSDAGQKLVKKFCNYVVDLKAKHRMVKELFESEDGRRLMDATAPAFFADLGDILIKYFLLESSKITERASSFGRENFTIAYMRENIDWPGNARKDIERLNRDIMAFGNHIKDARNRVLAHLDKTTVLSGDTLGRFAEGEDDKFISALEEMCNILHRASFGRIFGCIVVPRPGDVLDLKAALKKGVAFKKLLEDSKGNDKRRLLEYLQRECDIKSR